MGFLSKIFGSNRKDRVNELLAQGAVIIDVRNPGEFAARHFEGSKNIPLQEIKNNIPAIKAYNKPIVVCCASGVRSANAKSILQKEGLEVENAGGWRALEN